MKLLNYRKGSVIDIFLVMIFIFVMALLFVFVKVVYNNINNAELRSISTDAPRLLDVGDQITSGFDTLLFLMFGGMIVVLVISAFFVNTHPAFFFISLIALMILTVVSPMISNSYTEITNTSGGELSQVAGNFTRTAFIFDNFPTLMFVIMVLFLITTFVVVIKLK